MIGKIIDLSVRNRFLVILATLATLFAGGYAAKNIPLDAIPDLSDVQVIVFTEFPGQSPQVVEDQITYPLSTAMLSVPFAKTVRGYSFFGFSFVYILFEDGTDLYWARSRVLEYLNFVSSQLPDGVTPSLGPDATGVGWVYEYALVDKSGNNDLSDLRSLQDWYLKYELQTVPGVSEVASIGGFVKQYRVEVDPNRLLALGFSVSDVKHALARSNNDVGGRVIEMGETEFMIRGRGYIKNLDDIRNVVLGVDERSVPVTIKDVAHVFKGPEMRRGIAELDGIGETVGGVVVMRQGANARDVIAAVKKKLNDVRPGLPKGVEIVPVYDRSSLIESAVENLTHKLIEESIVVALICLLFLFHFRSALVAILSLPVGILAAFGIMYSQGINANVMSLGGIAIAIGVMIDGAIVMVENAHKHLAVGERVLTDKERWQRVALSCKEVGPSIFFSLLVIVVSFLPVFSLQAQEGRLFFPLAFTNTSAMFVASLVAITLVPVMIGVFIRGKIHAEEDNPVSVRLQRWYHPLLESSLKYRKTTLFIALLLLVSLVYPLKRIGSEFMPPLDEGTILYMPTSMPGTSITDARKILQISDKIISSFPEVQSVFGKIGRAETATDSAPISMIETTITLKPREEWRKGMTSDKLIQQMNSAIKIPGVTNAWTMPIKGRTDMLATGIKTPVGIKISGGDLTKLQEIGEKIEQILRPLPGTSSVYAERVMGGKYVDIDIDRFQAARYGLRIEDIQDVIGSAIGGMNVTTTVEGRERYPVNVRYPREFRDNIRSLKRVLVKTPQGQQVPLEQVAKISIQDGPPAIKSEDARLNAWVYVDVNTSDIGGYVEMAKKALQTEMSVPPGYSLQWSGQYEYMLRAKERLKLIFPIMLVTIFVLLFLNFSSVAEVLIIMLTLPFALVGGFWAVWAAGFNTSVAVAVGFIALAGLTVEIGVLMLLYMKIACDTHIKEENGNASTLQKAIQEGATKRLRPILMTGCAVISGLLPLFYGNAAGSDVMQRIALPMLGGMISSLFLTLFVLPVVYSAYRQWDFRRTARKEEALSNHE